VLDSDPGVRAGGAIVIGLSAVAGGLGWAVVLNAFALTLIVAGVVDLQTGGDVEMLVGGIVSELVALGSTIGAFVRWIEHRMARDGTRG
jgi:hypothetical protein